MSTGHSKGGSDMGAAFAGLIGGAIFIGAILYGIVLLTNASFKSHEAGKKTGSVEVQGASRLS